MQGLHLFQLSWLFYPLIGIPAGLLAGLLGVGGGIIVVPALLSVFALMGWNTEFPVAAMAVSTSLATIIFTSVSSIIGHHQRGFIAWPAVFKLSMGLSVGTVMGALIADHLQSQHLIYLFTVFLALTGFQMLIPKKTTAGWKPLQQVPIPLAGSLIGLLSSLFGIGGGSLTVPYLCSIGTPMRQAVGIGAATGFPIAVVGTVSFMVLGLDETTPSGTIGYVVWPAWLGIVSTSLIFAQIGTRWSHRLNVATLRRLFGALLLAVSYRLITS